MCRFAARERSRMAGRSKLASDYGTFHPPRPSGRPPRRPLTFLELLVVSFWFSVKTQEKSDFKYSSVSGGICLARVEGMCCGSVDILVETQRWPVPGRVWASTSGAVFEDAGRKESSGKMPLHDKQALRVIQVNRRTSRELALCLLKWWLGPPG